MSTRKGHKDVKRRNLYLPPEVFAIAERRAKARDKYGSVSSYFRTLVLEDEKRSKATA